MDKVLAFYNTYGMEITGIFILLLVIITCVQIHKINVIKKRMNSIAVEVKRYLAIVMEEEQPDEVQTADLHNARKIQQKQRQEEEQNRLISAVLEEIFP